MKVLYICLEGLLVYRAALENAVFTSPGSVLYTRFFFRIPYGLPP